MTLLELLERRRSARFFDPTRPLDSETLDRILQAARLSPSGFNLQPWRFVVVESREGRERLYPLAHKQSKVLDAPVVLICCGDLTCWADSTDVASDMQQKGYFPPEATQGLVTLIERSFADPTQAREAVIRDVMLAVGMMLMTAAELGVDAAPMSGFDAPDVAAAFDLPAEVTPVLLLALGYVRRPDPERPYRKPLDQLVCRERFNLPLAADRFAATK
jgi:nitroreductase